MLVFREFIRTLPLDSNAMPQAPPPPKVIVVWRRYAQRAWEKENIGNRRNKSKLDTDGRRYVELMGNA